ncbi:MAG: terminase small subunit [Flavobacteriaceae bacterium]|nr:terminase small subunit [Flavobacteriaceae bacterium]
MRNNALNIKQEAFCQAYLKSDDATASYKKAGYSYKNKTTKSIHQAACRMLKNSNVAARIEELKSKVAQIAEKKFDITHTEILNHLNILRNARIDEYVEYIEVETPITRTTGTGKGKVTETIIEKSMQMKFKPFDQLTKEQLMCIESIKQDRYGNIELKLHGKEWTIDKINKHIGFYEKNNEQKQPTITLDIGDSEARDKRIKELLAKANQSVNE